MKNKTNKNKLAVNIIALYFIIALFSPLIFAQQSKKKLQDDKKQLENEIAYANTLLNETRKSKEISLTQIIILNNKINQRGTLINTIGTEINGLDAEIAANEKETVSLTDQTKTLKEGYAKLIVFAYKNRNAYNRLMFLFASKDINQAFLRLKYLELYTSNRRKQAELIAKSNDLLKAKNAELKSTKVGKTNLLQNQESEQTTLAKEKDEKNTDVKMLLQKEKDLGKTIKQKEKQSKKLEQSIEAVIAAEIAKAAEKTIIANKTTTTATNKTATTTSPAITIANTTIKNTTTPAVTNTSKELGLSEADITLSNSFAANKGRLPWPTEKGVVTSTFGVHPHPVLSEIKMKNNGIDISTSAGAKARAVFDGKVTGIIDIPGANKAVIVRHGDYLTVYSNLSDVAVKNGDKIKIKQTIGSIYTDDYEAKTELHFEVWNGKVLVDPLGWLSVNK